MRSPHSVAVVGLVISLLAACGGSPRAQTRPPRAAVEPAESTEAVAAAPRGQLPEGVTPRAYSLALDIDPSAERFTGHVAIQVELAATQRSLWIHGKGLVVSAAGLQRADGTRVEARYAELDPSGVAQLVFSEPVGPGLATLEISYEAPFDRGLRGLYRVSVDGKDFAFTQFEATSARQAFPCFDEPRFKVPFDVTIRAPEGLVVAANTTPAHAEADGRWQRVRFAPTQALPTYLLAWAVGDLDVVTADDIAPNEVRADPIPLRGLAVRGKGAQLRYALARTAAMVHELERYFGVAYPYGKLDLVAVPDFAAGAMENAGLITFREWLLLLDEDAGPDQRRAFANVMAHELAHQWFGNLVTMPWWDDIWLNEAFATWMASKVVAALHPEFDAEVAQLASVQNAMRLDSLASARRIREPVADEHDIHNAFDRITYAKGGGVLAMLERWLGADIFRQGIRAYVREHAHGTATAPDLLRALDTASGRDVSAVAGSFLNQAGVPVIDVQLACDSAGAKLSMRQARYVPVGSPASEDHTWRVPVCVRYGVGARTGQRCEVLSAGQGSLDLSEASCPDWVMPNAEGASYLRFALSEAELARLERAWPKLTPRERLAVADSVEAAFDAAKLSFAGLRPMLARFAEDPNRHVALMPARVLARLDRFVITPDQDSVRLALRGLARTLYASRQRQLGWAAQPGRRDDDETRLLREGILEHLAFVAKDPGVRREAMRRGRAVLAGVDDGLPSRVVAPELVGIAVAVAVQDGTRRDFERALERFRAARDPALRYQLLTGLSHASDPELAAAVRGLVHDADLRVSERLTPLGVQFFERELVAGALEFLVSDFEAIAQSVAEGSLGRLPSLASELCEAEQQRVVRDLFASKVAELPGGPRNLAASLEAIGNCVAFREAHAPGVIDALVGR